MDNIIEKSTQGISARFVINGSAVTLNFADEPDGQVLSQVKNMLTASFSQSMVQSDRLHLENRTIHSHSNPL